MINGFWKLKSLIKGSSKNRKSCCEIFLSDVVPVVAKLVKSQEIELETSSVDWDSYMGGSLFVVIFPWNLYRLESTPSPKALES